MSFRPIGIHHASSYLIVCVLHSILCLYCHISFHALSDNLSHFKCIEDSHITTSIPMDIGWEILSWEGHLVSESWSLHHCLRVYSFNCVSSLEPICWYLKYTQFKKKGAYICMYAMSSFEYIYGDWELPY